MQTDSKLGRLIFGINTKMKNAPSLSIIVPVLNEGPRVGRFLAPLARGKHQLIIVDGGSTDETAAIARRYAHTFVISPKGRGIQQHEGARQATGELLIFVHADTILPAAFDRIVFETFNDRCVCLGAFKLNLSPSNPWIKLVAHVANLRSKLLGLPYGDQALFMRKHTYFKIGGFQDLPIMEDVDLVRRAKKVGKIKIADAYATSSARRWYNEGMLKTTLRNWTLMIRYFMGAPPSTLKAHYPDL